MDDEFTTNTGGSTVRGPRRMRRWGIGLGLVGAGLAGGMAVAGTLSAAAADGSSTPSAAASAPAAPGSGAGHAAGGGQPGRGPGGSDPVRSDETSVSSDVSATLKANALKAVPGGTVYRIETDAGDGAYEAHMTRADGTPVTVKFGTDRAVTAVEDGMGTGDPAPAGPAGTSGASGTAQSSGT